MAMRRYFQGNSEHLAVFFCLGPIAFFAPNGLWIPVALLLLLRSRHLMSLGWRGSGDVVRQNFVYLAIPAYGIGSALWAVDPPVAAITASKFLAYVFLAIGVVVVVRGSSESDRSSALVWTASGVIASFLFVWIDVGTAGWIYEQIRGTPFAESVYNRGAAVTACLMLPVTIGIWKLSRPWLAACFLILCIVSIFVLASEAAKLAVILGAAAYCLVQWRRGLFWLITAVPLAAIVAMPLIFHGTISDGLVCQVYHIKPSAAHRLLIYDFSTRKILEKPFFGWGMDSSRSVPGGLSDALIRNCSYEAGGKTLTIVSGNQMPLHPHNAALQIWLELGMLGAAAIVVALALLLYRAQRNAADTDGRPLIAATFWSLFIIYGVGFGVWQSWLFFALIMLFALMTRPARNSGEVAGMSAVARPGNI